VGVRRGWAIPLVMILVQMSQPVSAEPTSRPELLPGCEAVGPIKASALPNPVPRDVCDLRGRLVRDQGIGAVVPEEGRSIYVEALVVNTADDTLVAEELMITHHVGGSVKFDHVGPDYSLEDGDVEEDEGTTPSSNQCNDGTNPEDKDEKVDGSLQWYYNAASRPSEVGASQALDAIRDGGRNMVQVNDVCGHGDNVSAGFSYQGTTPSLTEIDENANCGGGDSISEVSWGNLPGTVSGKKTLAVECTNRGIERIGYDEIQESDVKFNKVEATWTTAPWQTTCSNKFDVEGVMTHERGHSLGMGHVGDKDSHTSLTMNPFIKSCKSADRTFGKGFWEGLDKKY